MNPEERLIGGRVASGDVAAADRSGGGGGGIAGAGSSAVTGHKASQYFNALRFACVVHKKFLRLFSSPCGEGKVHGVSCWTL